MVASWGDPRVGWGDDEWSWAGVSLAVPVPLAESSGAAGGYLLDRTFGGNYPNAAPGWSSSMMPNDQEKIEARKKRIKVAVALAALVLNDGIM